MGPLRTGSRQQRAILRPYVGVCVTFLIRMAHPAILALGSAEAGCWLPEVSWGGACCPEPRQHQGRRLWRIPAEGADGRRDPTPSRSARSSHLPALGCRRPRGDHGSRLRAKAVPRAQNDRRSP